MSISIRIKDSNLYVHMAYPTGIFFVPEINKANIYRDVNEAKLDVDSISKRMTGLQLEVIEVKSEVIVHE